MNGIRQILEHLERERDRLNAAIGALRPLVPKSIRHANVVRFKRSMTKHWTQTAEGRRRLSAIVKARWAKRAA